MSADPKTDGSGRRFTRREETVGRYVRRDGPPGTCCQTPAATAGQSGCCAATPAAVLAEPPSNAVPPDAVPVTSRITREERWTALKARLGIRRMDHRVKPGLYALSDPAPDAPVFATANYRLSFDSLRAGLAGLPSWILVLDTRGINVWCAAGKGTFGTGELIRVMKASGIADRVTHRRIVLPQLGASGVNAPEVERVTGFSILYGPVRASDIRPYIDAGYRKDREMSLVRFGLVQRAALVPVELRHSLKPILLFLGAAVILGLLSMIGTRPGEVSVSSAPLSGVFARIGMIALMYGGSVIAGTSLVPLFLPILPGRSLALKGAFLGILYASAVAWLLGLHWIPGRAISLQCAGIAGFFGLMFTGSTPYTSQSGTEAEMKRFGPVLAVSFVFGTGAAVAASLGGML